MRRRPERHPRAGEAISPRPGKRRAVGLLLCTALIGLVLAPHAWAAGGVAEIASVGPLTRIIVTGDLGCQVAHRADDRFEFYGPDTGACGTFLAAGGALHGPEIIPSGSFAAYEPWTPVSQSAVTGSGSSGDPYEVVTSVQAGATGLRIDQTDSYVTGEESYRTDLRIQNTGRDEQRVVVYRAGDCFLQGSDVGFGRVDDGAPACVISQAADARIEQWVPITSGSSYTEGTFSNVWLAVASQQPFGNTCTCDTPVDNGAGLSWQLTIPGGASADVAHLTFFSPEGRRPTTALRDSVPGPADVILDPVIVASSVAVTAGVVVLVPFPAALFNSALEENYAEVTRARRRVSGWLRRIASAILARGPAPLRGIVRPATDDVTSEEAPSFWTSWRGLAVMVLVSAVLYGLLDPTLGFDLDSLGTIVGLALGLTIMLAAFAIPMAVLSRRAGYRVRANALPGTFAVAVLSVIVSRVADFQPGYIYGLIIGWVFTRELSRVEEGRMEAFATGTAFACAVAAWLLLPAVRDPGLVGGQAFVASALETAFVTVVVAGVEATLFGMLPLRFLPGERVRAWNRRVWLALIGLGTFAFFHVLLNPTAGYLADTSRSELSTVIWLLAIFGGGSVLFWGFFRLRPSRSAPVAAPAAPAPMEPAITPQPMTETPASVLGPTASGSSAPENEATDEGPTPA